jgi:opacity protein-like surface antigen
MKTARALLWGAALVAAAGAASAADRGFYVGAMGGRADYDFEQSPFFRAPLIPIGATPLPDISGGVVPRLDPPIFGALVPLALSSAVPLAWQPGDDDTGSAWGAFAGYRMFRHAAVEVGYLDLGTLRARSQVTVSTPFPPQSTVVDLRRELHTSGPTASVLGILPLYDQFAIYLRAGVLFADMESKITSSSSTPSVISGSSSVTFGYRSLLWGGGLQYDFHKRWGTRLDFQRFDDVGRRFEAGRADVDLWSVGVLYRL